MKIDPPPPTTTTTTTEDVQALGDRGGWAEEAKHRQANKHEAEMRGLDIRIWTREPACPVEQQMIGVPQCTYRQEDIDSGVRITQASTDSLEEDRQGLRAIEGETAEYGEW